MTGEVNTAAALAELETPPAPETVDKAMVGTTGKVIDPNGVQVAAHYNNHPSGVEAIEVCRCLNFNVGNAFKYVYRRGDKLESGMTPAEVVQKDLDKALWYIRDEHNFCVDVPVVGYGAVGKGSVALQRVCDKEPSKAAYEAYKAFAALGDTYTPADYANALEALYMALEALKEYERRRVL